MKNRINNIVKSLAVAALGMLSLSSCNDFLTIYPTDKTIGENFWQNKEDVTQVVTGAYTAMINGGIIERMIMWGDYRSDELKKHPSLKNTTLDDISKGDLYPSSGYNSWACFYNVINTCNIVLAHAPEVMEKDPEFTEGDYQTARAQMLGLRALCHFYLVRAFRDIPYVTKAYENTDDMKLDGQLAPDSTLQLCIEDLEEAEKGCYNYGIFGEDDWRTTGFLSKDAINAILADVYLWRASLWSGTDAAKSKEYYQACIDHADKVINSHLNYFEANIKGTSQESVYRNSRQQYYLYKGLWADYYNFVKGNSSESVLELQFDGEKNSNTLLCKSYLKWEKQESGYGMMVGTSTVGGAIGDNPSPATKSASTATYFQSENDYRFYNSSYGVNDDNYSSYEVKKMVNKENAIYDIPTRKKGSIYIQPLRDFDKFDQNWIIYRITDVMLMKAEAQIQLAGTETNKLKNPFALIQAVNQRSISTTALKDTLVYQDNYNKADKMELLCLQERGRELCYEGKRWFDLVRYCYRHMTGVDPTKTLYEIDPNGSNLPSIANKSNTFKDILATKYSTNLYKFKNEGHLYWPILNSETKTNKLIHQNPVWVETQSSERTEE